MSRYGWYGEERDAYDQGRRGSFGGNPYERYGSHEEEQKHRAWDEGYDEERRDRERREEERAEEAQREHEARRAAEESAYDEAMYEQQHEEPPGPEPPEEEPQPMMQLALDIRQERARLSGQCAAILERLQRGPVTNRELAEKFSLKYTGRISELRQRGHDVRLVAHDHETGETLYWLFVDGRAVP